MPNSSVYNNTGMYFKGSLAAQQQRLLKLARSGNQEAFTELYDLSFEKIYRFIFYRVGHKEVAEDIAEDVFIKAFHSLAKLEKDDAFESWLYQISRNKIIDYYRSKKLVVPLEEVENTLEYETNIIDIVNLEQQQKIFVKILKELSPEQQSVIKMKFFDGLENDNIAALMDKTEGTIRVIQHRAISKLKELIDKLNLPSE